MQGIDLQVLQRLFAARTDALTSTMVGVSWWGEWTILIPLALLIAIGLFLSRHWSEGKGLLVSVFGSAVATLILKALVARPRPPLTFWAVQETWYSFPSAHAALSVAFWGFLAFVVVRATKRCCVRTTAICFGVALPVIIGFSRLYLGVHYLSDVLAGFAVGGIFLWIGILTAKRTS